MFVIIYYERYELQELSDNLNSLALLHSVKIYF